MSRRSPLNQRYGKHTAPAGKTRRSAASLKPKRARADDDSGSRRPTAFPAGRRGLAALHPQTPEYKRWRAIWWACLGGAILLSTLAWWLWRDDSRRSVGTWVLAAGYAMIFVAVGIDWFKMRPLRREWLKRGGPARSDGTSDGKKPGEPSEDES